MKMGKIRRNFTITQRCDELLEKLTKQLGKSKSKLVEEAIYRAYQDPVEHAREKMKHHQRQLEKWREEKEVLEDMRDASWDERQKMKAERSRKKMMEETED